MTTDNTSAPVGGATWERATAQAELIAARQSGDVDAEALAYTRYLDGAINASIGLAAQVMERIAVGIRADVAELAAQRERDRKIEDEYRRQMLDWRTELRKHIDARFDAFGEELDTRVGALESDFATYKAEQAAFNAGSQAHRDRLEALILRLPQSEQLKVIKEVQRELRRIAVRQWLQFIPIAIVVFMLFVWAVITLARMAP